MTLEDAADGDTSSSFLKQKHFHQTYKKTQTGRLRPAKRLDKNFATELNFLSSFDSDPQHVQTSLRGLAGWRPRPTEARYKPILTRVVLHLCHCVRLCSCLTADVEDHGQTVSRKLTGTARLTGFKALPSSAPFTVPWNRSNSLHC